jgi:hypothetical protein
MTLALVLSNVWDEHRHYTYRAFGDFLPLWSYAKIASTQAVSDLYNFNLIHAHQVALGMDPTRTNPCPYPPTALLLLWPLDIFSYERSYIAWVTITLALLMWAIVGTCSRSMLYLVGAMITPSFAINISMGQSGFLTGALIIAGIRLSGSSPVLSGVLLGILLGFKPQLVFLAPIALIATRNRQALCLAGITVVIIAIASTAIFGWAAWPAWLGQLQRYAEWFDAVMLSGLDTFAPTLTGNLMLLGLSAPVVQILQALAAVTVAGLIYGCFRRRGSTKLAAAAMIVGTFLATPHALLYDTPMLVGAVVLFIEGYKEKCAAFSLVDILSILLVLVLPVVMVLTTIPVSSPFLLLMFCRILWLEYVTFRLDAPRRIAKSHMFTRLAPIT